MEREVRSLLADMCRKTYERHLVVGPGGNVSGRLEQQNKILISPTGLPLAQLGEDDFVCVDMDGAANPEHAAPSSELGAHLAIYRQWPDHHFILHSHPPTITGLFCTNMDMRSLALTEDIPFYIKHLAVIDPMPGGTAALAKLIAVKAKTANAFILRNHGLMVAGRSASEALYLSELLEDCAKMYVVARIGVAFSAVPPVTRHDAVGTGAGDGPAAQ
jgi:L-fuculose-phosphate aldolase